MPTLTVIAEQLLAAVPGGTGRYARQITAALASSAPDGWTVRTAVAWHSDVSRAAIDGVDGPHRLPLGARGLSQAWLAGLPPWPLGDSVHATTPLTPGRRSLLLRNRPLVVTVHDTVPWTHPETLTPRGVAWHRTMIERAVRFADCLVVPTAVVAQELGGLFPPAVGRIRVIPHGVTALPAPVDIPGVVLPDRYVLSLATLEPRKGLDVLIDAMAEVDAAHADLVVVGQVGWGDLNLRQWAAAAGLPGERVHLLGLISDAQLAGVLAGAAALAVPSRAEGFGLPVLEGMAAGIPVIHSDAPALVEVGGTATVCVPRDDPGALAAALNRVLKNPELANELRAAGLLRAAEFSWERAAAHVWALHRELR